jgi:glutamate-1-semialdehyde aminotransferase
VGSEDSEQVVVQKFSNPEAAESAEAEESAAGVLVEAVVAAMKVCMAERWESDLQYQLQHSHPWLRI